MGSLTGARRAKRTKSPQELTCQILGEIVGSQPLAQVCVRLWDGSYWPSEVARPATLVLNHPGSLRRILSAGSEVALAEAYLQNVFDVEGDLEAAFELGDLISAQTAGWSKKLKVAHRLWQLPDQAPSGDGDILRRAVLQGQQHSLSRDRDAIRFHYDLSNEFYALWLDSRMTYSCAYFQSENDDLDAAQFNKLDYICRKLNLKKGQRLLDIGCGWGGLVIHAASHYGVLATGVTLSERQAEYARERLRQMNLQDRVEVRIQDYRTIKEGEKYDAVASVGMVEHVGRVNLDLYFGLVYRVLKPGGLFLNHGIGTGPVSFPNHGRYFITEYVFPDGELVSIAEMLRSAELAGFEVRDVEDLREHYALTLRHWVRRLEGRHEDAVKIADELVYRIWRLYMAGSAHGFSDGRFAIYQTLLTKLDTDGHGNYPLNRAGWYRPGEKLGLFPWS